MRLVYFYFTHYPRMQVAGLVCVLVLVFAKSHCLRVWLL